MSVIPKSSSENSEQKKAPSVPQKTRGLFPRDDGWYDVDENGGEKKLATMDDIPNNNPSIIKDISISKSEDYTNLSIEKQDGTTLNEEFYNKDQANTKFAIKSDIPDVTALTKEVAKIEKKKVGISDIVDDLNTYDSSKPLSANMGALLYSSIPDLVSQAATGLNLMDYNAVDNLIYNHNVDSTNHSDIRYEIQQIADRLTAFLDTDDTTLDQVSEIVAYINSNKELIDAITTSKVNVVDIVDDLQTSSSDRPLSANQGVQLMSMLNNLALDLYGFLDNTSDGNMYPLSNLIQQVYNKLDYTTVVDNLYTYDSYVPLSANMGNYLEVNKINYADIVDSFDNIPMYNAGGSYNPLSARLGYELYQGKIGFDSLVTDPTYMVVEDNYSVLSAYYGKQLYDYITLVAQNIPSSMSQLYDDVGYVMDTDYTHTDNNFTDEYKEKLDNLSDNPGDSGSDITVDSSYSPESVNAQSGLAVQEGIETRPMLSRKAYITTTEDAASILIEGLSIKGTMISGRLFAPGSNAGIGFDISLNGKKSKGLTGSVSGTSATNAAVRFWLWRNPEGKWIGRSVLSNNGINAYSFGDIGDEITSIEISCPYAEKYYATGTKIDILEGVHPNVQ